MYLLVMCNKDQYIHVLGAGLEKRFKLSLVCCAFETKSLPSKLCNYAQFNLFLRSFATTPSLISSFETLQLRPV